MRFRKKPVVIEAWHFDWRDGEGIPDIAGVKFHHWAQHPSGKMCPDPATAYVQTLEGPLHVTRGDWIIRGVKGEIYPCKPDIFAETYDPCD
jgi:hypothetical protein